MNYLSKPYFLNLLIKGKFVNPEEFSAYIELEKLNYT